MTFWQLMTFRQRKLCVVLIAFLIISSGCTARRIAYSARANEIVRDEPMSCEWFPWLPWCSGDGDEGGGSGGGSGAGAFPD